MAIKAQVPIVPVMLVGTNELLLIHTYHLYLRPLEIIIGAPISTARMTTRDADALTQRVQEIITATYIQRHPSNRLKPGWLKDVNNADWPVERPN